MGHGRLRSARATRRAASAALVLAAGSFLVACAGSSRQSGAMEAEPTRPAVASTQDELGEEPAVAPARDETGEEPASTEGSGTTSVDLSSPNAALRSLYRAVRDQDYDAAARVMGTPAEHRADLEAEFRRERDDILGCLENATVAETAPVPDEPRQRRVRLEGCPSKQGFTGRVQQHDDGTWTIIRL